MPEASLTSASGAGTAAQIPTSKYERLIATAKRAPSAKAVVVHPCDETSLRGAAEAAQLGLIEPLLVGPEAKIRTVARECKIDIAKFELVDAAHSHSAAAKAVELIRAGQGELDEEMQNIRHLHQTIVPCLFKWLAILPGFPIQLIV